MHDYGFFSYDSKADFIERSKTSWNPDKTQFWQDAGVDLVIDRRDGYLFWDMAGRRLIDLHLNGGTYNLGHRNPELIATLEQAMGHFDIGNHHFPALARTALAEALVATAPPNMRRVIYGSGGGEAIDIAIKTARHTRQRRKIVSIAKGYHGHTGLAVAAGDQRFSELFLSDRPEEFVQVPFNDLEAMEDALRGRDVAARDHGDDPGDLRLPAARARLPAGGQAAVRALRRALHRRRGADGPDADRRDVGHPRPASSPTSWSSARASPAACTRSRARSSPRSARAWLEEDGFGHISTGGGAELGCIVALKVLEICGRPEVRSMVHYIADRFRRGLRAIQELYPDWLTASARTAW